MQSVEEEKVVEDEEVVEEPEDGEGEVIGELMGGGGTLTLRRILSFYQYNYYN